MKYETITPSTEMLGNSPAAARANFKNAVWIELAKWGKASEYFFELGYRARFSAIFGRSGSCTTGADSDSPTNFVDAGHLTDGCIKAGHKLIPLPAEMAWYH